MDRIEMSVIVDEIQAKVYILTSDGTIVAPNLQYELCWLSVWLNSVDDILGDIELGHTERKRRLMDLEEIVYKAYDLIDELVYQILHPQVTHLNFLKKFLFNVHSARQVKYLYHLLDKLIKKAPKSSFCGPEEEHTGLKVSFRKINNRVICDRGIIPNLDNAIIGRDDDVFKIVNTVIRSCDQQVLTVVPVVGIDGLGKTALARLVCRQVLALKLFDVQMWVFVSEKYDELNVLGQMLKSLNAATMGGLTGKDVTRQQLEKELARKRFLLVLDDVSGDVSSWWGDFRTWLLRICSNNGNFVLVTTRSEQVASVVETSSRHRHTLGFLSDDDCRFILEIRALGKVTAPVNSGLKDIARKCRGVPLAAKVLGGTLGLYEDEGVWLEIRDSHFSKERDIEKSLRSILVLSWTTFPKWLSSCFAFCSIFPKGFLIVKEDLIRMWMAERFASSYEMGNMYFHALLKNSFLQDIESDDDGNVIKCKMNNLVHDLASSLKKSEMHNNVLYADHQSIRTSEALRMNKAKRSSTIILNGAPLPGSSNSKRLRTLYVKDVDIENLPSPINKLKRLRYLHVSSTKPKPLPESITEMYMLQILTLSNCSCEQLQPLEDLPFLKFLKISHMERVKCIGNGSYGGNSDRHQLKHFPSLTSLSLSVMENITEWIPPSHGNSVVFPCLKILSIQSCPKLTGFPMRYLQRLVEIEIKDCEELRLSFPSSVTSLSIVGCPKFTYLRNCVVSSNSYTEFIVRRCEWLEFIPDDLGMQRSLFSLQILCCRRMRFFSEGVLCKLTQLRRLSIGAFSEKLDDFCYLNRIQDLTCLQELEIWGSDVFGRKMSTLPNQLQHLARLQSLKIKGFTKMEALPEWLPNLRSLKSISVNYCWHLEYESTTALIQRCHSLSYLSIYCCRALEEHKSQWMEFSSKTNIKIIFQ